MFNLILDINKSITSTYLQRRYIALRVAFLEVYFLVGLGVKLPSPCLKLGRIMLEALNLVFMYTQI